MGLKLKIWQTADRTAHDAEMQIRSFGRRYGHMVSEEDVAQARELRERADRLFGEAMRELSAEVAGAVARQSAGTVAADPSQRGGR